MKMRTGAAVLVAFACGIGATLAMYHFEMGRQAKGHEFRD